MATRKSPSSTGKHPRDRGPAPGEERLVSLAKRVSDASGAPVVGGVAVILHGGGRATSDIDIYTPDWATHQRLEDAGILWNSDRREHLIDGVPVHMVGDDQFGGPPARISTIRGVRVVGLADLVRVKLALGLEDVKRHKDIAHVVDLIERVPLKKDFAAKLPTRLRSAFKELVEQVHGKRGSPVPPISSRDYFARYAVKPTTPRRRAAI
jgi:N-acyl-D-aspartate/D-glutamate deacylase